MNLGHGALRANSSTPKPKRLAAPYPYQELKTSLLPDTLFSISFLPAPNRSGRVSYPTLLVYQLKSCQLLHKSTKISF